MPILSFDLHRPAADRSDLDGLIRRDQLQAVRRSVLIGIPVNMILGLVSTVVAFHDGQARAGALWLAASTSVNLLRSLLCRASCPGLAAQGPSCIGVTRAAARSIDRHLRLSCFAALMSGIVWAFLPLLCDGYTSAQTLFYLTVTCGITAGAVTYGTAFARMGTCFIMPPLVLVCGCLIAVGGFDRLCLAAMVALYLIALLRGGVEGEAAFREASRLKNEAKALAASSAAAHASASALADEMGRRATHDDLTGLLNRAGFVQRAETHVLSPKAQGLILLDLDGFKSVNDVYGHEMGDRVLIEVANRLRSALPARGLAARLGGDEFAILYETEETGVPPDALASRLIAAVAQRFEGFDAGRVGISIGVYVARATPLTHRLICADAALYAAKRAGRNRFRLFDDGLAGRLAMRLDSERDLSQALAEGALEVWFQPIFGRDGRVLTGLEALVRWRHPHHGWMSPPDIIAAAAMAGLTEPLLRFILGEVCAMMETLRRHGADSVRVAMNVSPREMAQVAVDAIVLQTLRARDLPPAMLEIEITEETALDIEAVQARLLALSHAGIRVALDDFGIGYSSLASLRQLQADRIKIDRSIVTGLLASEDTKGLVQAVLGLGRGLDLEVVAEGVETADDLRTLQMLGCAFFQGYHLGRPMPAQAVVETLLAPWSNAA